MSQFIQMFVQDIVNNKKGTIMERYGCPNVVTLRDQDNVVVVVKRRKSVDFSRENGAIILGI